MTKLRSGRQKYYNIFSHFYDFFIKIHSRNYRDETRKFLVDSAKLDNINRPKVLDICCGTGSVILSFAEQNDDIFAIGYDFSIGMVKKAKEKNFSDKVIFIKGDAATLPFVDDSFDVVCCSHALYELKGQDRKNALLYPQLFEYIPPTKNISEYFASLSISTLYGKYVSGLYPG